MTDEIEHKPELHRFDVLVNGELAGSTRYRVAPGVRIFFHTEIDTRFEGRGLASKLIAAALDETRAEGLSVEPQCPYVRGFIAKHAEYLDMVAE